MKSEKEKFAFMITWVTYNSRVSERMVRFGVKGGESVWLSLEQELIIMNSISSIAKRDELRILGINICGDHMHLIMVCLFEERDRIVSKLKSISSRTHNIVMEWTVPEAHLSQQGGMPPCSSAGRRGITQSHLWAQKYHWSEITSDTYLINAIDYVRNNRINHGLPASQKLEKIINDIVIPIDNAFE